MHNLPLRILTRCTRVSLRCLSVKALTVSLVLAYFPDLALVLIIQTIDF